MTKLDLFILITGIVGMIAIALYSGKKTQSESESFFLAGRKLPWYIAGLSMVATTFAVDTPIAVAEFVGNNGISGNWIWWSFLAGGLSTAVFFAQYWRNANVITEVELINLRYSGPLAHILRKFKAVYLGLGINVIIIGWVNFAMVSVFEGMFDLTSMYSFLPWELTNSECAWITTFILMLLTAIYSSISGFKGVVYADAIQFIVAITACIMLAVIVVNSPQIGGIDSMVSTLQTEYSGALQYFPEFSSNSIGGIVIGMSLGAFFVRITVQWWASWYPGSEPGGGGYVAQRMFATKNSIHAYLATIFFNVAHYCIRPWPWILVGLCGLILYPELAADEKGKSFVYVIRDFSPSGMTGLMLLAFVAAYMSTISTQLNWGASYLTNDFFSSGIRKKYNIGRISTFIILIIGAIVSTQITSMQSIWNFLVEAGAGLGFILILRWFWYRVNVQAEITATIAPFIFYAIGQYLELDFANSMLFTSGLTIASSMIVMFIFPPEQTEHLTLFYNRVKPHGIWNQDDTNNSQLGFRFVFWIGLIIGVYSILFGTGNLILGLSNNSLIYLSGILLSILISVVTFKKTGLHHA